MQLKINDREVAASFTVSKRETVVISGITFLQRVVTVNLQEEKDLLVIDNVRDSMALSLRENGKCLFSSCDLIYRLIQKGRINLTAQSFIDKLILPVRELTKYVFPLDDATVCKGTIMLSYTDSNSYGVETCVFNAWSQCGNVTDFFYRSKGVCKITKTDGGVLMAHDRACSVLLNNIPCI